MDCFVLFLLVVAFFFCKMSSVFGSCAPLRRRIAARVGRLWSIMATTKTKAGLWWRLEAAGGLEMRGRA